MFTVPDAADAVATCPTFKPAGAIPGGFFRDCDPGSNFPGTLPLADYFNELIINLHSLLQMTNLVDDGPGVVATKGDPTMLFQAILRLPVITQQIVVYVKPGGTPNPASPIENSDPFDTLSSAMRWAKQYRMAGQNGALVIDIAPAIFTEPAAVVIDHPVGHRLFIRGDSENGSILHFPNGVGLVVRGGLGGLYSLTLTGDNVFNPRSIGLQVDGGIIHHLDEFHVANFGGDGVQVTNRGFVSLSPAASGYGPGTLFVNDCQFNGVGCYAGGAIVGTATGAGITVQRVGTGGGGAALSSGLWVTDGSMCVVDNLYTRTTNIGVRAQGNGATVGARLLQVSDSVQPAAVTAYCGAVLNNLTILGGTAGNWWTWNQTNNTAQYFSASLFSLINANKALAAYNLANCSPPPNVLGNVQSYVATV